MNLLNESATVAADASLGLQIIICGPKPDSFCNGNVHYKIHGEGVTDTPSMNANPRT